MPSLHFLRAAVLRTAKASQYHAIRGALAKARVERLAPATSCFLRCSSSGLTHRRSIYLVNCMRIDTFLVASVTCVLLCSRLSAQTGPSVPSSKIFDVTLGLHSVSGGLINFRTGLLLDALAAARLRTIARPSVVIGGGASIVLGGFGNRCLLTPSGGCAGKGNFVVLNALAGISQPLRSVSARFLLGPSLYDGANARSAGLQGRIDVTQRIPGPAAVGAMVRATVLPSHDGQALVAWAAGVSLAF